MFNHFRNQFAVKATYFQELLRSMARNSRRTSLSRETLAEFQVAKSSKENQTNFKKTFSQVRLPRHWDFSVCSGPTGQRRTTYARPSQPTDILIGRSHPIFGNNPWSLQNDGCGERGLVLNLPFAFLGAGVQPDPNSHKGRWA